MLKFDKKEIARWDEAIPLGNGNMGGLLFGDAKEIKLNIDSSSLWDLRVDPKYEKEDYTYDELYRLYCEGEDKNGELQERFGRPSGVYPTKIPCCALVFTPDHKCDTEFFFSMKEAVGGVKLSTGDKIECFFSATNFLGHIRYPRSVNIKLLPPDYRKITSFSSGPDSSSLGLLGYPEGDVTVDDCSIVYRQPMTEGNYSVLVAMREVGEYSELVFAMRSNVDSLTDDEVMKNVKSMLAVGYDDAFAKHKAWWEDYFSQVSVSLPEEYGSLEELYTFAHYLLGSGSRESFAPMALQGVWTAAEGALPPWRGDYHFDLNVQGTYNWAYRAGRVEHVRPLVEYFKRHKENIFGFSEKFFGEKGVFFIPGTADLNGNIMGGWVQYTYSLTSSMWMLLVLDKWCDYADDKDFLLEFIIPAFNGTYKLLMDKFVTRVGDKYELLISITPEINDNKYSAWVKNSTYDISIIKEFLKVYIKRLKSIGAPIDDVSDTLGRFVPESTSETGYLLAENMPLEVSHRHMSHCMNLFPFQTLDYRSGEDLDLMKRTLGNLEKCGTSMWIGFAFPWVAALYATAGDGEGALKYLEIFCDGFVSDNGFHLNGDFKRRGYSNFTYRPFTVEANGMYAEEVCEMLMQQHHGVLRLFPAIPKAWEGKCAFHGFALDAQTRVDASALGDSVECEISSEKSGEMLIEVFGAVHSVKLDCGINKLKFEKAPKGV